MIAGMYWIFWIYLMIALLDIYIHLIQYFKTYIKYSQVRKKKYIETITKVIVFYISKAKELLGEGILFLILSIRCNIITDT